MPFLSQLASSAKPCCCARVWRRHPSKAQHTCICVCMALFFGGLILIGNTQRHASTALMHILLHKPICFPRHLAVFRAGRVRRRSAPINRRRRGGGQLLSQHYFTVHTPSLPPRFPHSPTPSLPTKGSIVFRSSSTTYLRGFHVLIFAPSFFNVSTRFFLSRWLCMSCLLRNRLKVMSNTIIPRRLLHDGLFRFADATLVHYICLFFLIFFSLLPF